MASRDHPDDTDLPKMVEAHDRAIVAMEKTVEQLIRSQSAITASLDRLANLVQDIRLQGNTTDWKSIAAYGAIAVAVIIGLRDNISKDTQIAIASAVPPVVSSQSAISTKIGDLSDRVDRLTARVENNVETLATLRQEAASDCTNFEDQINALEGSQNTHYTEMMRQIYEIKEKQGIHMAPFLTLTATANRAHCPVSGVGLRGSAE